MDHPDQTVAARIVDLSRLLEPGEGLEHPDGAIEVVTRVGELARRREALRRARADADDAYERLVKLARQRVPPAAFCEGLEAVDLEPLEEQLQQILEVGASESSPLSLLQRRERVEALLWGARELWRAEDLPAELLSRLALTLERVDRLGRLAIDSFVSCNEQRQALARELDEEVRSVWWWSLRVACDPLRIVSLVDRTLEEPQRTEALEHLRGCEPCQRDLRALGVVEGLLGPMVEGHPPSREIVAFAAGELPATQRQAIAEHLAGCEECRRLKEGAAAGLAEAELVERSLELLDRQTPDDLPEAGAALAPHQPFFIAPAPRPRALAADAAAAVAPVPRDRRAIFTRPEDDLRAVYYAVSGQGLVTLFSGRLADLEPTAALDGVPLSPIVSDDPDQAASCVTFDLGPVARLPGRTLSVTFGGPVEGERTSYSWIFVTEGGAEGDRP